MSFNLGGKLTLDAGDFKRSAKEASQAIEDVDKDIKGLPDSADVRIEADAAQAQGDISNTGSELKELDGTKAEVEVEAETEGAISKVEGAFEQITSMGGIAGGVAATAFVAVFNAGMDRIQVRAKFETQFGLVKEDAERMSKEAGDLYAAGWGESLESVLTTIGLINQRLVQTGEIAEDELTETAARAEAVGWAFGDVEGAIDAVAKMMAVDLVDSAEEAFDALTYGLQNGAGYADDLYDTFGEYSPVFAAWGLSAEDMIGVFIEGMRQGVRDTDKLADAILEMRARLSVDDAASNNVFRQIGLDADEMRTKILLGGDGARDAFMQIISGIEDIEDPTDRWSTGVAAMGTMYEDVTGEAILPALGAVEDGLIDVADASDDAVTSHEDSVSEITTLWRDFSTFMGEVGENVAESVNLYLSLFTDDHSLAAADVVLLTDEMLNMNDGALLLDQSITRLTGSTQGVSVAIEDYNALGGSHVAALDAASKGTDHLRQTTDIATDAIYALMDAERALTDPLFAAQQATERYDAALLALNAEGGNTVENQRAVVEAAQDADYALLEVAGSADVTGESLYQMGLDAGLTEVQAYELAGQLMETKTEADLLEGEYQVQVDDDAYETEVALADARYEADLLDGKLVSVRVNTVFTSTGAKVTDGTILLAEGGPARAGDPYIVGEEGPELFVPDANGTVISHGETMSMLAAGGVSAMSAQSSALRGSTGGPGGSQTIAVERSVNVNVYGAVGRDEARRIGALIREEEMSF